MRHPKSGGASCKSGLKMYVREKKHRSGRTSVVIVDKASGKYREVHTVGISSDVAELEALVSEGKAWIERHRRETELFLDLFGEEREAMRVETEEANRVLSNISNVLLNGSELILGRVFDHIGFGRIDDPVFRSLVLSRLSFPSSKAATVEYLKNYFDEDVSLSKIYRYLDKLSDGEHTKVEGMSVEHTRKVLGGSIGVIFYDVTTLYFEADREDELRRTGFSKEGRHRNPQIILGLLVSLEGYPLAYCIHPGNEYEGHTMLPVVREFVDKYNLEDFIVVADSGLMNEANVAQLEGLGYKYIIGERIRNKGERVTRIAMSCPRCDGAAVDVDMGGGRRLLVSYSEARARKDAYNREKGVRRLEKSYSTGRLTKDSVNKRGYNKFLEMGGKVSVSINYDKVSSDAEWDGLKGYLTNTDIPHGDVFMAYGNL